MVPQRRHGPPAPGVHVVRVVEAVGPGARLHRMAPAVVDEAVRPADDPLDDVRGRPRRRGSTAAPSRGRASRRTTSCRPRRGCAGRAAPARSARGRGRRCRRRARRPSRGRARRARGVRRGRPRGRSARGRASRAAGRGRSSRAPATRARSCGLRRHRAASDGVASTRHWPSIRRCECRVRPPSMRCSRCLPRLTTSIVARPLRSAVEISGQRRSASTIGLPAEGSVEALRGAPDGVALGHGR